MATVQAARNIGGIIVGSTATMTGDCWATIRASNGSTQTDPLLDSLLSLSVGRDFHGTLASPLVPTLTVGRDFYATAAVGLIRAGGGMVDVWRIGRSFKDGARVEVRNMLAERNGLAGAVVINANNGAGVWEQGARVVGYDGLGTAEANINFTLENPAYTNEAYGANDDAIGNGAVGVARFALHATACGPDSGAVVHANFPRPPANPRYYELAPASQSLPDKTRVAFMRFYGRLQEGSSKGFIVERRRPDSAAAVWQDVTAAFDLVAMQWFGFDWELNSAPGYNGLNEGFEYRVRPVLTGGSPLRCTDVPGLPAVNDFAYTLTVADPCPSDLTQDSLVNSDDLASLLGSWNTCPALPAPCFADLNGDGLVNSADLPILLGSWGACPPADEGDWEGGEFMMMAQGGGDDPLYEQFGFESAAAYAAWFSSLDEAAQNAHVAELIGLLLGGE